LRRGRPRRGEIHQHDKQRRQAKQNQQPGVQTWPADRRAGRRIVHRVGHVGKCNTKRRSPGRRFLRDNTRMPSLTTQASITFLYYNDLPSACAFYESALGLALVVDQGWCKIYAITPQSWVGLVDAEHGTHKPAADKPVILSFVTDDVDLACPPDKTAMFARSAPVTAASWPSTPAAIP
jgi:hypothetical protein